MLLWSHTVKKHLENYSLVCLFWPTSAKNKPDKRKKNLFTDKKKMEVCHQSNGRAGLVFI